MNNLFSRVFLCLFAGGARQELPKGLESEGAVRNEAEFSRRRSLTFFIPKKMHFFELLYSVSRLQGALQGHEREEREAQSRLDHGEEGAKTTTGKVRSFVHTDARCSVRYAR